MVRQGESSATETLWSDLASRSSERERPRDHGDLNKTLVHTPSSLVLSRPLSSSSSLSRYRAVFPRLENLITSSTSFHRYSIGSGREIICIFFPPILSPLRPISHDAFPYHQLARLP